MNNQLHYPILAPLRFDERPYEDIVRSVRPSALIAYWPLNELGGLVAYDKSGYVRNGAHSAGVVLNSTPFLDGTPSPRLDGNDFINIYSASLAAAFNGAEGTFSLWVKAEPGAWFDAAFRRPGQLDEGSGNNRVFWQKHSTNSLMTLHYLAGGVQELQSLDISTPNWFLLTTTWSKSNDRVRFYVNGVQHGADATVLGTFVGSLNAASTFLGAADGGGSAGWNGWLRNAGVWSAELTAAEVATLYNNGFNRMSLYSAYTQALSPLLWLRLRETTGIVMANSGSVGSALNGALVGTTPIGRFGALDYREAADYDGATSAIDVPNHASLNALQTYTVAMLVKPDTAGEGNFGTFYEWGNTGSHFMWFNGSMNSIWSFDSGGASSITTTGLAAGRWVWLFKTIDFTSGDKKARLYKGQDGVVTEYAYSVQTTTGTAIATRASALVFGNRSDRTRTFDGTIDEVLWFDRVLTSAEMLELTRLAGV